MRRRWAALLAVFLVLLILGGVLSLPPLVPWVTNAADTLRIRVRNFLFPQNEVIFQPEGTALATITPQLLDETNRPPTNTPFSPSTPTSQKIWLTSTPAATPTPLPVYVNLTGVRYESQNGKWNYCAPTNLSMLLSYWGWKGDRFATGAYLKPWEYDLNVMPYELLDYIETQTKLGGMVRSGGTQALLKRLIAGGFPVLVERSVYFVETTTGVESWMGHYQVFTGYDEKKKEFIAQDSYQRSNLGVPYDSLESAWRAFNYTFVLAYTPDKKEQLMALLGDYADAQKAEQIAYQTASQQMRSLTGIDQYYAWYNRGSSMVKLQDYNGAAAAFDEAFKLYPSIPEARRPWRNIWYQTGPYFAYFYSGRYQDVINLASATLDYIQKRSERLGISDLVQVGPYIEETWFWRARAKAVLGDTSGAKADLQKALKYHPGFQPAMDELKRLGVAP